MQTKKIIKILFIWNILTQFTLYGQQTNTHIVTDSIFSMKIYIHLPDKYIRKVFLYEEGMFIDYYLEDGAKIVIFRGALVQRPILSFSSGYIPTKIDSLSDIVIYQGEKSNKCWKEIQTNNFTAYYDNVPLEKKRFYDDILSSITPINNSK